MVETKLQVFDLTTMSWSETGSLPEGMDGNALLAIERGPWAGQVPHNGFCQNEDESWTNYYPVRNVASHPRCCTSVATDRIPSLGATWLTSLESSGQHHHDDDIISINVSIFF